MIKVSARTVAVLAAFTLGISIIATPAQSAPKLKEVRVALSSFQDVCSIYVGIENGFYKQAGIKLNVKRTIGREPMNLEWVVRLICGPLLKQMSSNRTILDLIRPSPFRFFTSVEEG